MEIIFILLREHTYINCEITIVQSLKIFKVKRLHGSK